MTLQRNPDTATLTTSPTFPVLSTNRHILHNKILVCRKDPSKIYINVGLGYYVEFPLEEALVHIDRQTEKLNSAAETLAKESASIKAHIKLVLEVLALSLSLSL